MHIIDAFGGSFGTTSRKTGLHIQIPRTYNPMHETCNISSRSRLRETPIVVPTKEPKTPNSLEKRFSAIVTAQADLAEPCQPGHHSTFKIIKFSLHFSFKLLTSLNYFLKNHQELAQGGTPGSLLIITFLMGGDQIMCTDLLDPACLNLA